jgi:hypothetical protein
MRETREEKRNAVIIIILYCRSLRKQKRKEYVKKERKITWHHF